MQSGKAQVQQVEGHAAGNQKQIRTSSWWINHSGSVHTVWQSWLINTVYHLLLKINKCEGGGGGGLKERGRLDKRFMVEPTRTVQFRLNACGSCLEREAYNYFWKARSQTPCLDSLIYCFLIFHTNIRTCSIFGRKWISYNRALNSNFLQIYPK